VRFLEDGYKKKNNIIFGIEEKGDEGYFGTQKVVVEFLRDTTKMDVYFGN
jgi:hypothetical protein